MIINRPTLGVSTLVRHRGRVLLVKRGGVPLRGLWALPGGQVEPGERLAEAASREVREETGVEISSLRQIGLAEIINRGDDGGIGGHFVLVVFRGEYLSGEPVAGDDAAEARWIANDELPALPIADDTRRIIAENA